MLVVYIAGYSVLDCVILIGVILDFIPPEFITKPIPVDSIPFVTDTPLPPEVIFPLTLMAAFYDYTFPFNETPKSLSDLTLP